MTAVSCENRLRRRKTRVKFTGLRSMETTTSPHGFFFRHRRNWVARGVVAAVEEGDERTDTRGRVVSGREVFVWWGARGRGSERLCSVRGGKITGIGPSPGRRGGHDRRFCRLGERRLFAPGEITASAARRTIVTRVTQSPPPQKTGPLSLSPPISHSPLPGPRRSPFLRYYAGRRIYIYI